MDRTVRRVTVVCLVFVAGLAIGVVWGRQLDRDQASSTTLPDDQTTTSTSSTTSTTLPNVQATSTSGTTNTTVPDDQATSSNLRDDQARASSQLAFLGDSVFEGMDTDEYFPGYLAINRGVDRNQVGNMLERVRGTVLNAQPRCVVVMGGVNDISLGTPSDWIQAAFRELLDVILDAGANVVIVTTPQPAGGVLEPFVANDRRIELNSWIRQQANSDATRIFLADFGQAADDMGAAEFAQLTFDGYHPSAAGYTFLGSLIAPHLDDCLQGAAPANG